MTTTNSASSLPGPVSLARILLIDDDPISREVLAMMLEMHGIAIDTAGDGEAALALLDEAQGQTEKSQSGILGNPLVILMDTQMPGLSGVPLVEALRTRCQGRIVAISGSAVSEEIREATDGFLMKPIEVEALVNLLEAPAATRDVHLVAPEISGTASKADLTADDAAILDPLILGKFRAMMPAKSVREIYVAVADDLKPRLEQLEAAMQSGDGAEVRRIAHAIKGGCAMVGLIPATNAAARLETSNGPGTYAAELAEFHIALEGLRGRLAIDFEE